MEQFGSSRWPDETVIACDPADDLESFVEMRAERDEWCADNCRGRWNRGDPGDMLRLHYRFERDADAAKFMLVFDASKVLHKGGGAANGSK